MDRLEQMRLFIAVAEDESFAAAARRLRISPPAVTRAVAALEASLGVKLLNRTTRSVRVTETGERYLEDARLVLEAAQAADDAAAGINGTPRGQLAVTAPVLFGKQYVTPVIVDYLQQFPDTTANTLFVDRIVNLVDEGLDVGVRIGELPDSTLQARRVGSVIPMLVAAPSYLSKQGTPTCPQELREHTLIASRAGDFPLSWRFADTSEPVRVRPRLVTTTNDSSIEATRLGLGITRAISYQINTNLADGSLVRVLGDYEPAPLPVNVIHREGRYSSARTRAFIEMLVQRLSDELSSELSSELSKPA